MTTEVTETLVRRVTAAQWQVLREVRLAALAESPGAFGSTLAREVDFDDAAWRDRAARGGAGDDRVTFLAWRGAEVVGLVGGFVDDHVAATRPGVVDLVSMWTSPAARRAGVASSLVGAVAGWARDGGGDSVELWVVRGNDAAIRCYERCGFVTTAVHQPLPSDPCAQEVRMVLDLRRTGSTSNRPDRPVAE